MPSPVLVIGCGALGRELHALRRMNGWSHVTLRCLPAELHNRPERIAPALREAIAEGKRDFEHIFVAYADCGSKGAIDCVVAEYGIERLPGAHCYEFFAGSAAFHALAEAEPGTFYVTDFLVRHFDRLVRRGLGLDRHPELMPDYFGNYRRLVYLSQADDPELDARARGHARFLGLDYQRRHCGFGPFDRAVTEHVVQWPS
ncbi:MAG TPA: DUF1638 domain-containing protein [Steroidobacteraceae bacterium]|nr:DUF1638 domain-containing protein [Steroidobacteraceae bacterium]